MITVLGFVEFPELAEDNKPSRMRQYATLQFGIDDGLATTHSPLIANVPVELLPEGTAEGDTLVLSKPQ